MAEMNQLSRRERQIMDIVYRRGRATAAEVVDHLPDAPSYSAVRALLRILEEKGHLDHDSEGTRYVYYPTVPRDKASRSAMQGMLGTFFDGSAERAVAALLDLQAGKLTEDEYDRLSAMIDQARKEGR